MPETDGFELAEKIRRGPRTLGALMLTLSSADEPGVGARCR